MNLTKQRKEKKQRKQKKVSTPRSRALISKKFAIKAAKLAIDNHCTNVVVLELKGKSSVTDYFVIATGTSNRQMRTVADEINGISGKFDFSLFGRAGYEQARWILLDFVDVVVHIFDKEYREFYDLELLWGDAKRLIVDK